MGAIHHSPIHTLCALSATTALLIVSMVCKSDWQNHKKHLKHSHWWRTGHFFSFKNISPKSNYAQQLSIKLPGTDSAPLTDSAFSWVNTVVSEQAKKTSSIRVLCLPQRHAQHGSQNTNTTAASLKTETAQEITIYIKRQSCTESFLDQSAMYDDSGKGQLSEQSICREWSPSPSTV